MQSISIKLYNQRLKFDKSIQKKMDNNIEQTPILLFRVILIFYIRYIKYFNSTDTTTTTTTTSPNLSSHVLKVLMV